MEVRMLDNRVLIEPARNPELSEGGVYTGAPTTTFTQRPGKEVQVTMGRVLAIGPGKRHPKTGRRLAPDLQVGQYVAFSDTCHRPAGIPERDWIVIHDDDVIGISDDPIERFQVLYTDRGPSILAH